MIRVYGSFSLALTQEAVRRSLAAAEEEDIEAGTAYVLHADVSATVLITLGLDLEEQQ